MRSKIFGWLLGINLTASLITSFMNWQSPIVTGLHISFLVLSTVGMIWMIIAQQMLTYVLRRTGEALVTLFIIATLTFLMLRYIPGGPFDNEKALPADVKANIEAKYGLNDPLPTQYVNYMVKLVHGDFGESYKYIGRSVADIIKEAFPVSFQLGVYALILSYLIGIPLGVMAAAKHNTWIDTTAMIAAMSGVAVPSFLTAPILIIIFCFSKVSAKTKG